MALMAPKNVAAWALKAKTRPLVVSSAPYTKPPKGYIVVKVYDVAINPVDWLIQDQGGFNYDYPAVFGIDAAGEVVEVGEDVDEFKIGARVIAHCTRDKVEGVPSSAFGAFQKYVLVKKTAVAELPHDIRTSVGVVLPLGISTASAGLFQKGFLALPFPSEEPETLKRSVLIWGGSSSVASCAIQLAVAAGAEVVTTASSKNFEYCKQLGASAVFDYHQDSVEDDIVKHLEGKTVVGAYDAISVGGAVQACARVVDRTKGKAIVVTVRGVPDEGIPESVRMKAIASSAIFSNDVGSYIWRRFLPGALKSGTIVPKPDPKIAGEELRSVQLGLDTQKKGVSANKIVVTYIS